jgi:SAM-dependent methyltransferase
VRDKRNLNAILIERFVAEELAQQHARRPLARFLDVGCGDLRYRRYAEKPGWECVFSDFEARAEGVSIRLDVHALPFKDESFDTILITEVLEHLANPGVALREIRRVLRYDGDVILTVPFIWGLHEIPFDFYRYTEFGLCHLLQDAGLDLIYIQRRGDFIGVCLALSTNFHANIVEYLRRKMLLLPLSWIIDGFGAVFGPIFFFLYMLFCGSRILQRYDRPGCALKSVTGQMNAWPLGVHLVARRSAVDGTDAVCAK